MSHAIDAHAPSIRFKLLRPIDFVLLFLILIHSFNLVQQDS